VAVAETGDGVAVAGATSGFAAARGDDFPAGAAAARGDDFAAAVGAAVPALDGGGGAGAFAVAAEGAPCFGTGALGVEAGAG